MDEKKVREVAKQYGTPFFLYDGEKILEQHRKLKDSLYDGAGIFYSMKANPLIGICQLLYSEGCGIETASKGEIQTALEAGVKPSEIIFSSPGKTVDEIEFAIEEKIKVINVESVDEAILVNEVAKKKNRKVEVVLRINQNVDFSSAKIKMSGVSSQFGIEETDLSYTLFEKFSDFKHIEISGIQVYSGTQVLKATEILQNTEYAIQMAIELSSKYEFQLRYLNLGGGFGIPYFKGENALDLQEIKNGMHAIKNKYNAQLKNTEIIFESGRFLMAESGIYVTKILYKKISKGSVYYICDGGSNFHSTSAFLGRFVRNNFPMYSIPTSHNIAKVNVVGPLCTPTDTMGQKVELSEDLNCGDYIVIEKSGAYGLTYSPMNFLSHDTPIEILELNKRFNILRERGDATDLWRRQRGL